MIREIILKNRSYRRFNESVKISGEQVTRWVELARYSASGRNMQPLKYVICTDENLNGEIYPNLGWAGYLTDWNGPGEGERPVAYVAVLIDRSLADSCYCDDGIAMQNILLGAVEDGYGGCIIGTVNKIKVAEILSIPPNLEILWIIALGKPSEKVVLDTAVNGNIKYYRDAEDKHHVPKRPLKEIIFRNL